MNPSKTRSMTFSNKRERLNHPVLSMGLWEAVISKKLIFIPTLAVLFKIICHGIVIYFQSTKRPLTIKFVKVTKV
jgi:hypothetical protein